MKDAHFYCTHFGLWLQSSCNRIAAFFVILPLLAHAYIFHVILYNQYLFLEDFCYIFSLNTLWFTFIVDTFFLEFFKLNLNIQITLLWHTYLYNIERNPIGQTISANEIFTICFPLNSSQTGSTIPKQRTSRARNFPHICTRQLSFPARSACARGTTNRGTSRSNAD